MKFKNIKQFSVTRLHEVCVRYEWDRDRDEAGNSKVVLIS